MKSIPTMVRRGRFSHLLAVGLLAIALPQAGHGAFFEDLYTVTVAGDPAAANVSADAMRRGLAKVLTRVTGHQDAGSYPEMQDLLDASADFRSLDGRLGGNRWRFEFNSTAVNRALDQRGLPVWGPERPSTLLWLAVAFPSGNRAELASDSAGGQREPLVLEQACGSIGGNGQPLYASDPLDRAELELFEQIVTELLVACDERGLPMVVPALDDVDQSQVRFADVQAAFEDVGFEEYIGRAAERYSPDSVLIGQIDVSDLGIETTWTQLRGERSQTLPTQSLRWGIDSLADQYASELAIVGDSRVTWITVRDVLDWPDYGRVVDHIESSSLVESVDIESISGNEFTMRVVTRGNDADLERYLTLDGELRSAVAAGPARPQGLVFVPGWHATDAGPAFRPIPGAPFDSSPEAGQPGASQPRTVTPSRTP